LFAQPVADLRDAVPHRDSLATTGGPLFGGGGIERMRGPYEHEPVGARLSFEDKYEILMGALDGVELGTYDETIVRWLCHNLDSPIIPILVDWLQRARRCPAAKPR
jgi:hypothetical protein